MAVSIPYVQMVTGLMNFGLYCMAGNVAEWTSSLYYEGGYNFQHDMNPDIRYKRKGFRSSAYEKESNPWW